MATIRRTRKEPLCCILDIDTLIWEKDYTPGDEEERELMIKEGILCPHCSERIKYKVKGKVHYCPIVL